MSAQLHESALAPDDTRAAVDQSISSAALAGAGERATVRQPAARRSTAAAVDTAVSTRADSGAAAEVEVPAQRRPAPLTHAPEQPAREAGAPEEADLRGDAADRRLYDSTERSAVSSSASRDERFAQVYEACWPPTVRFIARRVEPTDLDSVEDLAQATFLRAWRYRDRLDQLGDFDADEARHQRYLWTVARNVIADHYRTAARRQRGAERPSAPDAPVWRTAHPTATADRVAAVDRQVDLAGALQQHLTPETRQVLVLRFLDDLPIQEVAERMGRSRAHIVRRQAEGLATLRDCMAADDDAARPADEAGQADPLLRARRAVAQVGQLRAVHERRAGERARAAQLARWHADDQADDRAAGHGGALEGSPR